MLIRYADWKRPTDGAFAFRMRASVATAIPPVCTRTNIADVVRRVLEPDDAERFETNVLRWTGPEDATADGGTPYSVKQEVFVEVGALERVGRAEVEAVLRGDVLVCRSAHGVDYVMRDHHTVDVALYEFATRGRASFPTAMFHADRHSDWCRPTYLDARQPEQAATWWALLEGLKKPGSTEPWLRERDVVFTTALPPDSTPMAGRNIGAATQVPGALDTDRLGWRNVLEDRDTSDVDWVSLDLDCFLPSAQYELMGGLLRDAHFDAMLKRASVRVFVLSPQFLQGGEKLDAWTLKRGLWSAVRLVNVLRHRARVTE